MADLLFTEGSSPRILALRGEKLNSVRHALLVPNVFEGIEWGAHIVCEATGVVYDPILPEPLPLTEYLSTTFSQSVVIEDYSHILRR